MRGTRSKVSRPRSTVQSQPNAECGTFRCGVSRVRCQGPESSRSQAQFRVISTYFDLWVGRISRYFDLFRAVSKLNFELFRLVSRYFDLKNFYGAEPQGHGGTEETEIGIKRRNSTPNRCPMASQARHQMNAPGFARALRFVAPDRGDLRVSVPPWFNIGDKNEQSLCSPAYSNVFQLIPTYFFSAGLTTSRMRGIR